VARYFSPEAKQAALKMVKAESKTSMQSEIQSLPWMGACYQESRRSIKLHAIANKIGYPDKWRDYSAHWRSCAATRSAIPNEPHGSSSAAGSRKSAKPVDRNEWSMTPPTINAYYDDQKNDINFPAGSSAASIVQCVESDAAA
jgi:putative endopeptidase